MSPRLRLRSLRGSLTFRAVAGMGLAMLVIILTGSAILYAVYREALSAHFHQEGETLARSLARSSQLGVFTENPDELRPIFEAALENEDIIAVYAYRLTGEPIFKFGAEDREGELAPPTPAVSGPLDAPGRRKTAIKAGDRHADFWAYVQADTAPLAEEALYLGEPPPPRVERPIGLVCIRISTDPIRRWLGFLRNVGMAAAFFFLVVSVATTFLVIRAMHRPLSALLADLRQSGRMAGHGREEELLSATYHDLLRQLNDSFRMVEQLNLNLEEKVRERTSELTGALTELRQTQAQLVQSAKMAAMGELVAGLAHEINNATHIVLHSLANLGRRLNQGIADPRLRRESVTLLAMIEEAGRRTAGIVRDLMTFARPSPAHYQHFLLNQGLRSTISLLEHHFAEGKTTLLTDFDEQQPHLRGRSEQLNQVALNLLLNAIQAAGEGGTVKVATRHDQRNLYLEVADSGPGVAPEARPYIFDPFFTTKRPGKGTGLGLAVSYRIVAEHGGSIELVDSPEWGALFRVTLPREVTPNPREPQS